MVNYMYIITCICTAIIYVDGGPWANPAQEILDELYDAEIYNAVVTSMNEWQRKQNERKHQRSKRDIPNVCYADVGCFEASGPFAYLDMLPDTPEQIGTRFLLYPSQSKRRSGNPPADIPFQNITTAFSWAKQGFNSSLPTKVLIHGFGSDCSHIWVYEMRSALMAVEDVNVICVDWRNGAVLPNYVKATANTRLIGKQLAMLLRGLVDKGGLSLRKIHLIGFSLGAHVAGFAGSEIGNLSRITGLDPAGPLFESQDTIARLDQDDADFVDVIHSNGENLILGGLGSWQPMGHVDFYPNGGRMQKGCSNIFVGAVSDIIWSSAVEGRSLCNHRRAYKFFTDSVSPRCHFPAFPCESYEDFLAGRCFPCTDERRCGNMGYYADRSKGRGQLYLITRDEEPFCAHQYHIKIESSPSEIPIISYGKIQITLISDSLLNETFTLTKKEDEEMRLGSSVERIIVPHPILLEPSKIQILYSAYSGWLTSGLLQWKIDKVTLSDSFGRSVSVCKKNLILDSNVPVILPLFPGECNVPRNDSEVAENRLDEKTKNFTLQNDKSKFVPTPVVKIGTEDDKKSISIKDAFEMFNIPWSNENTIDGESEQSRAFNTRVVKMTKPNQTQSKEDEEKHKEVVEPILKTHASKSGRSHDPLGNKPEITEPILGPTTVRAAPKPKPNFISKLTNRNDKELTYNFYDEFNESDWIPSVNPVIRGNDNKWKRQDSSRVLLTNKEKEDQDALNVLMRTVQFLPRRLARMFEEAEKYTRETILPFVSTYTPRFLSDFISPVTPRYVPLRFEEGTQKPQQLSRQEKSSASRSFNPPPNEIGRSEKTETTTLKLDEETPYTNIQKIKRKSEVSVLKKLDGKDASKENETQEKVEVKAKDVEIKQEIKSSKKVGDPILESKEKVESTTVSTVKDVELAGSASNTKEIYVNLPIFDDSHKDVKYIPLRGENTSVL